MPVHRSSDRFDDVLVSLQGSDASKQGEGPWGALHAAFICRSSNFKFMTIVWAASEACRRALERLGNCNLGQQQFWDGAGNLCAELCMGAATSTEDNCMQGC